MFSEACGTYHITHNGTNCSQLMAGMYAMVAARVSTMNLTSQNSSAGDAAFSPGGGGAGGGPMEPVFQKV